MEPKQFVDKLARANIGANSFNQYSDVCRKYDEKNAHEIRCQNLMKYFEAQQGLSPKIMLVGESAGHNGGRRHGLHLIGSNNFSELKKILRINISNPINTELSDSTTVKTIWDEIHNIRPFPLTFNIFPFHSHPQGNQLANRAPTKKEITNNLVFIDELIKMFKPDKVIAIGRVAESGLNQLNVDFTYVRHPSMGGKNKFLEQLRRVR